MSQTRKRIIAIVIAAALVTVGCGFALDRYALSSTYARVPDNAVSLLPTYDLYNASHPRSDVEFKLGDSTLRGHVYGQENTRGLIIFRHGIFSKHSDYLPLICAMVDKGWRVFAYDAIGCGESDGDSTLGMSQSPLDVIAAVQFAREANLGDGMPLVLWGHSWGGYGVATALRSCADVSACVSMSGYDSPMGILDHSATSAYGPLGKLQYPLLWLNTYIDFGENANLSASEAIVGSGVPTLVIHGTADATVPYENVSIFDNVRKRLQNGEDEKVSFIAKDAPGRNGHNNYFYSPESQSYLNECSDALMRLLDEHGDDAAAPEVQSYLASVNLARANVADPALIDEIDSFLAKTLHV